MSAKSIAHIPADVEKKIGEKMGGSAGVGKTFSWE